MTYRVLLIQGHFLTACFIAKKLKSDERLGERCVYATTPCLSLLSFLTFSAHTLLRLKMTGFSLVRAESYHWDKDHVRQVCYFDFYDGGFRSKNGLTVYVDYCDAPSAVIVTYAYSGEFSWGEKPDVAYEYYTLVANGDCGTPTDKYTIHNLLDTICGAHQLAQYRAETFTSYADEQLTFYDYITAPISSLPLGYFCGLKCVSLPHDTDDEYDAGDEGAVGAAHARPATE
jgi:hypothetical protein